MSQEAIAPLPPPPKNTDGESAVKGKHYSLKVSNKNGYLCHVHLEATFDAPPATIFQMFTCEDNSHLFRDVKGVAAKRVVRQEGGVREVEVEQLGEIRVLWLTKTFSTHLKVIEDTSNPDHLKVEFVLTQSDVLAKFSGKWDLTPTQSNGQPGTLGILEQDVLPKGVPPMMKHIPILGNLIRGVSVRAVQRILEDMQAAVQKLKDGMPLEELLRPPNGTRTAKATTAAPVGSFAIDDEDLDDADEAPGAGGVAVALSVVAGDKVALRVTPIDLVQQPA